MIPNREEHAAIQADMKMQVWQKYFIAALTGAAAASTVPVSVEGLVDSAADIADKALARANALFHEMQREARREAGLVDG